MLLSMFLCSAVGHAVDEAVPVASVCPSAVGDTVSIEDVDSMASRYLRQAVEAGIPESELRLSSGMRPELAPTGNSVYAFDNPENHRKHPWNAALEAFAINAGVWAFDFLVLDADFAKINFNTIRHNIKNGFVWDNDQFSTNLFAHPYHGGLYFNSARSNGMNFWESVPYSFFGSLMWETMLETEPPAINDLIATTLGGVCIGEITHRISDLVYDDRRRGFPRFLTEFVGAVVCPVRALNRIISGDAWKVRRDYYKYHDYSSLPVKFSAAAGYRYIADNNSLFRGEGNPYLNINVAYGDPFSDEENSPYDYFTADFNFGMSSNQPLISGIHLLGRLWSAPIYISNDMKAQFGFYQHFNYYDSQPVKDGSSQVPFRISEAAALGPGLIYKFPKAGSLTSLEQRIFVDAILLGGSLSDYYNVIDRDYNMGSGFSFKVNTFMEFGRTGSLALNADFYRIYTWKGYEDKDLKNTDPLYLNAQGDKGNASLLVFSSAFRFSLSTHVSLDFSAAYYLRRTVYSYHDNVNANTFDARIGLMYSL